jgi:hypothetical protein
MYRLGQQQIPPGQQGSAVSAQGLSDTSPLPFPIECVIKDTGEQITGLQTTNWPAHSPSLVAVDGEGEFLIASFNEVRATDSRVLPNTQAQEIRNRTLRAR